MKAAWKSDVGKVRANNEDYLIADTKRGLFLLADGMGGHAGGEVASELAVRSAYAYLEARKSVTEDIPRLLAEALAAAHSAVFKKGMSEPSLAGMGTTLDMTTITGREAWVCHVGDSRVYLVREGKLRRVTADDNVAGWLMKQKHLAERDVPPEAWHILTQAVGTSDELVPDIHKLDLQRDDLIILCSDGLTGMLDDDAIERAVQRYRDDLERTVTALVEAANDLGGVDNVSVIIVEPAPEFPDSSGTLRLTWEAG
jgi:protein phosphatase